MCDVLGAACLLHIFPAMITPYFRFVVICVKICRVSIALGGKAVMSSALPVCSGFLADASDWRRRKAGLLTLLLIGEVNNASVGRNVSVLNNLSADINVSFSRNISHTYIDVYLYFMSMGIGVSVGRST